MALDIETPSEVMYGCLKRFGGVKNNELARILFSQSFTYGGMAIVNRLDDRTFVSRVIARAAPGDFPERAFRPFHESARILYSKLAARYPKTQGKKDIISYFTGEACERMVECLRNLNLNDLLYKNMVLRLDQMDRVSVGDKAVLVVLLFIATGALGNPSQASKITLDYARRISSDELETEIVNASEMSVSATAEQGVHLCLCRLVDGKMRMPAYPLSVAGEGTEIGLLATSSDAINDVGPGVSRKHLRIFRGEDGNWYAEGMGSTNGTSVIRSDGREEPIELPRSHRARSEEPKCVRLFANDVLRLAGNTYFAVLEIM